MHQLSRTLILVGILLLLVGAVLALLCGLSVGLFLWHDADYTVLAAVLKGTFFVTYMGSLLTLIGGLATGLTGLAIKAVAWGLRRYRL